MVRNALIAGATGLVGHELVSQLIRTDYYNSIQVISRRAYTYEHQKVKSYIIDFNQLQSFNPDALIRDVYVCLGTTLKKAGSIENFRTVDYQYVVDLANWAIKHRVERFTVISSVGADKNKKNYYLRTKGEMEEVLKSMGFRHLIILRPSLLLGKRKEIRVAEQLGKFLMTLYSPFFFGSLKNYKPVQATAVARNMFFSTINSEESVRIVENSEIINTDQ
jgi:uncharacterized protein YbjT (DUF2867 family)